MKAFWSFYSDTLCKVNVDFFYVCRRLCQSYIRFAKSPFDRSLLDLVIFMSIHACLD